MLQKQLQKQPPEVLLKKGVLKTFAKFTGKHLCQTLFFNNVAGLRSATLLKNRLWHRCFPVSFGKILKHLFSQNTSCGCFCSYSQIFFKKAALKNFAIFTAKHLCWSLLQVCNFMKKRLQISRFFVNNSKFFRTPFWKNICERLLLRVLFT